MQQSYAVQLTTANQKARLTTCCSDFSPIISVKISQIFDHIIVVNCICANVVI